MYLLKIYFKTDQRRSGYPVHSTLMDNRKQMKQCNSSETRGDLADIKASLKDFLNYYTKKTGRSVSDLKGIIVCFVLIYFILLM